MMSGIFKRIPQWDSIKKFGQLEVTKPSGVALVLVPFIVYVHQLMQGILQEAISQERFFFFLPVLYKILNIIDEFQMPTILTCGYLSALCLILAQIYYNVFCPYLIKKYEAADSMRYAVEVGGKSDDLKKYLYTAYKNNHDVLESFGLQREVGLGEDEFAQKLQWTPDILFGTAYHFARFHQPLHRLCCMVFYLVGFGFLSFIFIVQTYRVINFFLKSS